MGNSLMIRFWGISLLLFFSLSFSAAKFSAQDINQEGRRFGVVLYSKQPIMRLISKGEYLSPFARAQVIAYRMNENISSMQDLKDIVYHYPSDIFTAYMKGKKLFSIYTAEVNYNKSTPEGLMGSWMNNLKRFMIAEQQKLAEPPKVEQPSAMEEKPVKKPVTKVNLDKSPVKQKEEVPTIQLNGVTGVNFVELEALKEKVSLLEKKISQKGEFRLPQILLGILIVNIILTLFLAFKYISVSKKVDPYNQVDQTHQLEELENAVSVLIRELQNTSDNITEKTKQTLKDLGDKLDSVKQDVNLEEGGGDTIPDEISSESAELAEKPPAEVPPVEDAAPIIETPAAEVTTEVPAQSPPAETPPVAASEETSAAAVEPEVSDVVAEKPAEPAAKAAPAEEKLKEELDKAEAIAPTDEKPIAEKLAEEIEKQSEEPVEEVAPAEVPAEAPPAAPAATAEDGNPFGLPDDMDPDLKEEVIRVLSDDSLTKNNKVVELAAVNMPEEDIARYLDMGVGEVQLILQMSN